MRYLVIESWSMPTSQARTEQKGWKQHSGNLTTKERPSMVNHLSDNTMRYATVIIDVDNDKVIKNRHKTDGTIFDDEILATYKEKYREAFVK